MIIIITALEYLHSVIVAVTYIYMPIEAGGDAVWTVKVPISQAIAAK